MSQAAATIACAGCGWRPAADDPYPFRCVNADRGDDTDHILAVTVDSGRVRFPGGDEPNPFIRYRELSHSYHLARAHGMSDAEYIALVDRLDRAIAAVDGRGFVVTPFQRSAALSDRLGFAEGGVWVKDETGNVSGSHKGRQLMGILIHLEEVERIGRDGRDGHDLAIASCGNAALAAAVVARAGDRRLRVFVPTWADPAVLDALKRLGAQVVVVPRPEGMAGDPTYHALQDAVANGALPFTCQGTYNGLTIEGGKTIGYEMISALREDGVALDRLFVQVGGGALASAVIQAYEDGVRLGVLERMPRIHAVQTEGGSPLHRAFVRVWERMRAAASAEDALRYAVTHRSEFMWPWETEPTSIATGILDDETYDWAAVVRGMITSGGYPLVVSEETLAEANRLAREATGVNVDPTGSAGLAGLLHLQRGGLDAGERVAVLFTGVQR